MSNKTAPKSLVGVQLDGDVVAIKRFQPKTKVIPTMDLFAETPSW